MSAAAEVRVPPYTLPLKPEGIPDELKALQQFVCWDWEYRVDKWTKPPINPYRRGYAKSNDPDTWGPFETALSAYQRRALAGVGFALFSEDPFFFIDLDHCRNAETGDIDSWALDVLTTFRHTNQSVSVSGTGMRIIGRGKLPSSNHTKMIPEGRPGAKIEFFDQGKYTTLTGHVYGEATEIADCQDALEKAFAEFFPPAKTYQSPPHHREHPSSNDDDAKRLELARTNAKNGGLFTALFDRGDTSGHGGDQSRADQALCNLLAFWFRDPVRIDRIFRNSGLMREKWDTKHYGDGRTYGEGTIDKALAGRTEFYTPRLHLVGSGRVAGGDEAPPGQQPSPNADQEPQLFNRTDTGNAERLVHQHGENLRYIRVHKTWLVWSGTHWSRDDVGHVDQLAKQTVRSIPDEAKNLDGDDWKKCLDWAKSSESAAKRSAMIDLARSEEGIPAKPDDFDRDPWLLNVKNGTIDLRTGTIQPHDREDKISKLAPVTYDPTATCPQFLAWLNEIMLGREELVTFIQRALGYSLTGKVSERVVFILHGGGRNGKTTLLETMAGILGDYAGTAPSEMLLAKRDNGIPNDIARLPGNRFVSATETGEGRRLDEVKVKSISGGDTIQARFMHAEWFDFRPTFKIWLGTNHRPEIRGTDNAIWDRIRLIPFDYRVSDNHKVADLSDIFITKEAPGILSWIIGGCLAWQRNGLSAPAEVMQATEGYRREMDPLANWIEDRCDLRSGVSTPTKTLYTNYSSYCESSGEGPLKQRTFGMRLTERGCGEKRTGSARYRTGIRLRDPNEPTQATFDEDSVTSDDTSSHKASHAKAHNYRDSKEPNDVSDACDTSSGVFDHVNGPHVEPSNKRHLRHSVTNQVSTDESARDARDIRDEKSTSFSRENTFAKDTETNTPYVPYDPIEDVGLVSEEEVF